MAVTIASVRRRKTEIYWERISDVIRFGEVNRLIYRDAQRVAATARLLAPKRSGRLAASHRVSHQGRKGRFEQGYMVENSSPYAKFVHEGTGVYGPRHKLIRAAPGTKMGPLGPNPSGGASPRFIRHSLGQKPNRWLELAGRVIQ